MDARRVAGVGIGWLCLKDVVYSGGRSWCGGGGTEEEMIHQIFGSRCVL